MSDPISIIGTGVGIVSLGLQIYGELKKYLDTYAGRDVQVSKALDYLKQLDSTLAIIRNTVPDFESEQRLSSDIVTLNLQQCKNEMMVLQTELQKHKSSAHTDLKGKMKEAKKKLQYPLARDALLELEGRLERILEYLSLAIDGLSLGSLSSINTKVSSLNSIAQTHTTALAEIKADAVTSHATTSSRLIEVHNEIRPLAGEIDNLRTQTGTYFAHLENQMQTYQDSTNMRLTNIEVNIESRLKSFLLQALDGQTSASSLGVQSVLMGRLLSKPSLLKDAHEAVDSVLDDQHELAVHQSGFRQNRASKTDSSLMMTWNSACCCYRKRREVKRQSRTWSPFILTSDASSESRHHPYCPCYRAGDTKGKQEWTVTFIGLRRLLSTAVSVGFSKTYGAGGGGISPIFRYCAMVDHAQSPAFRIVSVMADAMHALLWVREGKPEIFRKVLSHGISRVQTVYANGTASPSDVDSTGATILDSFVKWLPGFSLLDTQYALIGMSTLFGLGIPSRNQERMCSLMSIAPDDMAEGFSQTIVMALREAPECNYQWLSRDLNFIKAGSWIHDIAEALEFDALCNSFIRQDEKTLRHALSCQPKLFDRFDEYSFKNVFFPLAVHWPAGFRILLDATPSIIASIQDYSVPLSKFTESLLQIVLEDCKLVCTSKYLFVMCDDCNCSESLEVLLDHNYFLSSRKISEILRFVGRSYPTKVAYVLLQHLKQWRERLWGLLAEHLPGRFQQTRPEDTPLLDVEAPRAIAELKNIGISPYVLFGLERGDYRLGPELHDDHFIHNIISSAEIAQLAFDMGFRDVEAASCGVTPLMSAVVSRESWELDPDHCEWLAQHGADVTRHVPWVNEEHFSYEAFAPLPRHTIFHKVSVKMGLTHQGDFSSLCSRILDSIKGDGCSCACSPGSGGCSPITTYINTYIQAEYLFWYNGPKYIIDRELGRGWLSQVCNLITHKPVDDNATSELVETIIRSLTFNWLEIRHTCCNTIDSDRGSEGDTLPVDYGSDFEELRAEDTGRLCQLEQLVTEFIEQYRNYCGSLSAFLRVPWTEQMHLIDVEESKEKWSEHEKIAVTSIGVIPKYTEELGPVKVSELDYQDSDQEYQTPEYWIRKLDIIANEGRGTA
ncbi:hypothetical protein F5Y19DRAFT_407376 [Xylariaceae sp. FL1651]|nr:hypothetical protein F5Y19DRAFT_407376 [Xylariaceae sp. FL1651]